MTYLDADAIVLDFSLAIDKQASSYPNADIILSADIRQGLMNSGFMIIKNTPWSRQFLQQWWTVADRSTVCDQDAFDLLYQQFSDNDKAKVRILATDALNSHPPAWKHFSSTSGVLHLMGESANYRAVVFHQAFQSVCQAKAGGILRKQLSLSLDYLQDAAKDIYRIDTQEAFKTANRTHLSTDIARLMVSSHHYVDVLSTLLSARHKRKNLAHNLLVPQMHKEVMYIRENELRLILHIIELNKLQLSELEHNIHIMSTESKASRSVLLQELVDLLKQGSEAGNSLFWSLTSLPDRVHVASIIEQLLMQLEQLTASESIHIVTHMQALLNQNLGLIYYEAADKISNSTDVGKVYREIDKHLNASVVHLNKSLDLFAHVPHIDYATAREYAHSRQLYAASVCMYVRHQQYNHHSRHSYSDLTATWQAAIDHARANAHGLQTGKSYEMLGIVLFNAAQCLSQYNTFISAAAKYIAESISVLKSVHADKSVGGHDGVETHQVKNMLLHAEQLLIYINRNKQTSLEIDKKVMKKQVDGKGEVVYVSDEEEWEECHEDEEGCEDFYVDENPALVISDANVNITHERAQGHIQHGVVDITEQERQALQEIRDKHAAVQHAASEYRSKRHVSIEDLPKIYVDVPRASKKPSSSRGEDKDECDARAIRLQAEVDKLRTENLKYQSLLVSSSLLHTILVSRSCHFIVVLNSLETNRRHVQGNF
ncbi:hypothetical protein EON65_32610 [archaeon]|nr:MAG: hypothetical protein EON65_32610 [archaeon]